MVVCFGRFAKTWLHLRPIHLVQKIVCNGVRVCDTSERRCRYKLPITDGHTAAQKEIRRLALQLVPEVQVRALSIGSEREVGGLQEDCLQVGYDCE